MVLSPVLSVTRLTVTQTKKANGDGYVTQTIYFNQSVKAPSGWKLSSNKKSISKKFTKITNETIIVYAADSKSSLKISISIPSIPKANDSGSSGTYKPRDHGFGKIDPFSTNDLSGKTVTESIFKKKPLTFINYWATWCGPCRAELPDFKALYDKYGSNITFLTIIDDGTTSYAKTLSDQYLYFATNVLKNIRSGYVPTSVIVDQESYILTDKIIGAYGSNDSTFFDKALKIVGK
jgi:thiol-disulfide isomerase/thioredoxin